MDQTVIECLKQACTGALPPNTRSGQSFIHDPKASGSNQGMKIVCTATCLKEQARSSLLQPMALDGPLQMSFVILNGHIQIAGETEVKAVIRLRFRTYRGEPIVVIRTFQVCQPTLPI